MSPDSPFHRFYPPVVSVLDSADIEVTDSRLPHATIVDHRRQVTSYPSIGGNLPQGKLCTPVSFIPAPLVRDT